MHTRIRTQTHSRLSTVLLVLLASLLLAVPLAHAVEGQGITVTHNVTVEDINSVDEIPLVALMAEAEGADQAAFELKWSKDVSAWFPTWSLQLSSDLKLISGANQSVADLGRVSPTVGHTYEASISYSHDLGIVAIKLTDLTDDRVAYVGAVQVTPYGAPLHAAAGSSSDHYLPIGNSWNVGQVTEGGTFLPLFVFETRDADAIVRLSTPSPLPADGAYNVYLEDGDDERLLATIVPDSNEVRVAIPLGEMSLGSSMVRLEYVQGDSVVLSESRRIVLGRMDFWMGPIVVERAEGVVKANFNVRGAEPFEEPIQVDIEAILAQLAWNASTQQFDLVPYGTENVYQGTVDLSEGLIQVAVDVPLPDHEGNWQVVVTPTVYPDVAIHVSGNERLFSTYNPAQVAEGEPYTFVVFPDTQYFAASYPHIFTRMTDWVTSSAEEYNIVGLLHVGDITDNNTHAQWDNAYRSLSLLNDVVPYVLTIGNHDMVLNGVRRGVTRVNDYFPEEAARRYSNLEGTLVPGRIENSYALFSIAGDNYVVIALEFGPPDEAVAWAGEVAEAYPDHKMILLTHSYTARTGGRSTSPSTYAIAEDPNTTVNTAPTMWEKLLRRQPNSFLVVSGHTSPTVPVLPYGLGRTMHGNYVYELLFDWQNQPNGGNGWLGLITFNPDGTIRVRIYSPYLDEWASYVDGNSYTSEIVIEPEQAFVRRIRP